MAQLTIDSPVRGPKSHYYDNRKKPKNRHLDVRDSYLGKLCRNVWAKTTKRGGFLNIVSGVRTLLMTIGSYPYRDFLSGLDRLLQQHHPIGGTRLGDCSGGPAAGCGRTGMEAASAGIKEPYQKVRA